MYRSDAGKLGNFIKLEICAFSQEFLSDLVVFVIMPIGIVWRNTTTKKSISNLLTLSNIPWLVKFLTEKVQISIPFFRGKRSNMIFPADIEMT